MQYTYKHFFVSLVLCLSIIFYGCSIPKRIADNIVGNDSEGLIKESASAKEQIVVYSLDECFDKVLAILGSKAISAQVLKTDRKQHSILALISRESLLEQSDGIFDTNNADVGIFLSRVGPQTTKVQVRSLSSVFVDYTSKIIFPELQRKD
jgi:hypothetical protein